MIVKFTPVQPASLSITFTVKEVRELRESLLARSTALGTDHPDYNFVRKMWDDIRLELERAGVVVPA